MKQLAPLALSTALAWAACTNPRDEVAPAAADAGGPIEGNPRSGAQPDGPVAAPADVAASALPDGPVTRPADADRPPPPDAAPPDAPAVPPDAAPPPKASGEVHWKLPTEGWTTALAFDQGGNLVVGAGGADHLVLAKYAPGDGAMIWQKSFGASMRLVVEGLAVAPDGTLGTIGDFQGTGDFGGRQVPAAGKLDLFVATYTPDGDLKDLVTFKGDGGTAGAIVSDGPSGDWFITASIFSISIAGQTFDSHFVARLRPSLTASWAQPTGTFALAAPPGALFVGGEGDRQLSRHDRATGTAAWSKGYGLGVTVRGAAADAAGHLVVVGDFTDTIALRGQTAKGHGMSDAFVLGVSPTSGEVLWSDVSLGSQGNDYAGKVCMTADGTAYVGLDYAGKDPPREGEPAQAGTTAFLAKYHADGTREWVKAIDNPNAMSIACDAPRGIYVGLNGGLVKIAP